MPFLDMVNLFMLLLLTWVFAVAAIPVPKVAYDNPLSGHCQGNACRSDKCPADGATQDDSAVDEAKSIG